MILQTKGTFVYYKNHKQNIISVELNPSKDFTKEGGIAGFLVALFPHKIIFYFHVPRKILKCSVENLCDTKIVKLFYKTSFFHFQFITSRKKAGSCLGHRADVMNTKRRRICCTSSQILQNQHLIWLSCVKT